MLVRTFFLALLFAVFGSPLAMAEEIGGGSPDKSAQTNNGSESQQVESEGGEEDCLTEVLLRFFFGEI